MIMKGDQSLSQCTDIYPAVQDDIPEDLPWSLNIPELILPRGFESLADALEDNCYRTHHLTVNIGRIMASGYVLGHIDRKWSAWGGGSERSFAHAHVCD